MPRLTREMFDTLTALKCGVAYNQYGGYCVPMSSHHRVAAKAILSNHVYEPKTITFLTSNWTAGDIIHAGTYFGDFLPALSAACPGDSIVWAFEPNMENYRCAQITALINACSNVQLTHAGLGEKCDISRVRVADAQGQALGGLSEIITSEAKADEDTTEVVKIVTIDHAIPNDRPVSIIQLDVEGFESQALSGGMATIQRCRPIIVLEILQGRDFVDSDWFADNILKLEYSEVGSVHGNAIFACRETTPVNSLQNMDPVLTTESIARL